MYAGARLGSGGVVLDSSAKSSIVRAENALEATDSDLRLQLLLHYLVTTPCLPTHYTVDRILDSMLAKSVFVAN